MEEFSRHYFDSARPFSEFSGVCRGPGSGRVVVADEVWLQGWCEMDWTPGGGGAGPRNLKQPSQW